jgi:hypothetical protein
MRGLRHQGVLSDTANALPTPFQRAANALPTGCVFHPPYPPRALVGPPVGRRANAHEEPFLLAGRMETAAHDWVRSGAGALRPAIWGWLAQPYLALLRFRLVIERRCDGAKAPGSASGRCNGRSSGWAAPMSGGIGKGVGYWIWELPEMAS